MGNAYLDKFMEAQKFWGLTFDDVNIITQYADFLPSDTNLETFFSRNVKLNIPFVSAAMDTVTESSMAITMALLGGIGIIHKNLDPHVQRTHVKKVKYYLNGFLKKARTISSGTTVKEVYQFKQDKGFKFNSFPIIDNDKKLRGIITGRELKYAADENLGVDEIMIKNPVTAKEGTTIEQAYDILLNNKISILPIVNDAGEFLGMYCFNDVKEILKQSHPLYNRDNEHKLRCGAAVGPNDYERVEHLLETSLDVIVVDTAHGHTKNVIEMIKWIKKKYPQVDVVGGNVATGDAVEDLIKAGADGVKVGIGPGSICTTRVVTGVGVPQITAVYNCRNAAKGRVPVIADGGIKLSGDVPKAIIAGASCVMMGAVLAGTEEAPGEKILYQGRQYVMYRGMGSIAAMNQRYGSKDRYGQSEITDSGKFVPEGIEGMVPFAGSVSDVLYQYIGGLRSSMGYSGTKTLEDLRLKGQFTRCTDAGRKEAHPHDVIMTKDAPNYKITNTNK